MQCALFLQTMINDSGKDNDFLPVQMKRRKPWKKVLYEDQGVPDNYVDKSFLDEMRKNREYSTLWMRIYIKLQSLVYRFCDALYWCAACAPFGMCLHSTMKFMRMLATDMLFGSFSRI